MRAVFYSFIFIAISAPYGSADETPGKFYEELVQAQSWTGIRVTQAQSALSCVLFARPTGSFFVDDKGLDMVPRGERAAYISWPLGQASSETGQISFGIGHATSQTTAPLLVIDGQAGYRLLADGDAAYTHPQDDGAIREALRRGSGMFVQSELSNGQIVRDTYSLIGVQAATEKMIAACK